MFNGLALVSHPPPPCPSSSIVTASASESVLLVRLQYTINNFEVRNRVERFDLREIGSDQWRDLVSTLINLRTPLKMGNSLIS
jgi:hypothetical protein